MNAMPQPDAMQCPRQKPMSKQQADNHPVPGKAPVTSASPVQVGKQQKVIRFTKS
jgi:hypothetical protein